jgi:hypothetical protein
MSVSVLAVDDEADVADLFRQHFRREVRQGHYGCISRARQRRRWTSSPRVFNHSRSSWSPTSTCPMQDAAYQSLLRSRRQQFHQRIAQTLVERFPEVAEADPALIAHHYREAGVGEPAIAFWQKAGQRAIERSANREAIAHLTRGLEVLKTQPESPGRDERELKLQMAIGVPLIAIKGMAAPRGRASLWARASIMRAGS